MNRDDFMFPHGFCGWQWLKQKWLFPQPAQLRKYHVAPRIGTCTVRRRLLQRWLPRYAASVSEQSAGERAQRTYEQRQG